MDGNFQHAAAVRFLHNHGKPGQVLAGGGIGVLVRRVQRQGQEGMLGGVTGTERYHRLLGK